MHNSTERRRFEDDDRADNVGAATSSFDGNFGWRGCASASKRNDGICKAYAASFDFGSAECALTAHADLTTSRGAARTAQRSCCSERPRVSTSLAAAAATFSRPSAGSNAPRTASSVACTRRCRRGTDRCADREFWMHCSSQRERPLATLKSVLLDISWPSLFPCAEQLDPHRDDKADVSLAVVPVGSAGGR